MSDRTERGRRERILLDIKEVRKKVRREGFMETRVHEGREKMPKKHSMRDVMDALEEEGDDLSWYSSDDVHGSTETV
jgi:hypothetical protein